MSAEIVILTEEDGKDNSAYLKKWIEKNKLRAHGVLVPEIKGVRYFYNPYMDVKVEVEPQQKVKDPDKIYESRDEVYSRKAYKVAASWLRMKPPLNSDYFLIDGIGRLELEDEGLEPELGRVIKAAKDGKMDHCLLLGVRIGCKTKVIKKYSLHSARSIYHEDLQDLLEDSDSE